MLKAIILDFSGAILNDEPFHFAAMRNAEECLVLEDSVGGVNGASAAGILCMAVTNSYPSKALRAAKKVVSSVDQAQMDSLQTLFEGPE